MAMVTKRLFDPSKKLVRYLAEGGLKKVTQICGAVVLERLDGQRLVLGGGYGDIEFKFEVFFMTARSDIDATGTDFRHGIELPEKVCVDYLFRAEWECIPTRAGAKLEQQATTKDGGLPNRVPSNASAAGVYLAGIGFREEGKGYSGIASICDTFPGYRVHYLDGASEIREFERDCQSISLAQLGSWLDGMASWERIDVG